MLEVNLTSKVFHMQALVHFYKPKPSFSLYKRSSLASALWPVGSIDWHCFALPILLFYHGVLPIEYVFYKILSTLYVFLLLPKISLLTSACPTLPFSTSLQYLWPREPHAMYYVIIDLTYWVYQIYLFYSFNQPVWLDYYFSRFNSFVLGWFLSSHPN